MLKELTYFSEKSLYFLKQQKLLRSMALFYIFANLLMASWVEDSGVLLSTSAFYLFDNHIT